MKKGRTIIGVLLFAALLILSYFAYQALTAQNRQDLNTPSSEPAAESQKEKISAPDFTVYDAEGNEVRLSDFVGKPVVLNFWASWCPPCKSEMPHFDEVYADVKGDVVFMMVNMTDGQRETRSKGQAYIDDNGFAFPVYFDSGQEAAIAYGIRSIPTTLFIDKDGYIRGGYQGMIDKKTLQKEIEALK